MSLRCLLSRSKKSGLSSILNARQLSNVSQEQRTVILKDDPETGIATMILNKPPVNSLGMEFMREIIRTADKLESDGHKGVIITSSSKTVFSAGLNFPEIKDPDEKKLREFWTTLQEMFYRLYSLKIPSAALINGHAPAGGTLLALCCDYRVMTSNPKSTIGLNEIQLGLPLPFWLSDAYVACIGQRHAEYATLTGELYNPQQALSINLVDKLFEQLPDGEEICKQFLLRLIKLDPFARHTVKMELRRNLLDRMKKEHSKDLEFSVNAIMRKDFQDILKKYLDSLKKK